MQSITALAHIRAAIIYVMDISEQCNYSLEEQVRKKCFTSKKILSLFCLYLFRLFFVCIFQINFCCIFQINLFNSIRPLFTNKPVLVAINKVDVLRLEELSNEKKVSSLKNLFFYVSFLLLLCFFQVLFNTFQNEGIPVLQMSTVTLEGVIELRNEVTFLFKTSFFLRINKKKVT